MIHLWGALDRDNIIIIVRLWTKILISIYTLLLNENGDVTTNVSEDWIPLGNSHFSNNVLNKKRHTDMLHLYI